MEYNEPTPMQIGGFKPIEKSFNLKKYGITYQISTDKMIGFFHKSNKANLNLKRLEQSKIIEIPHAPKTCRLCRGYMQLARNGEGYSCRNQGCVDKRNLKRMAKKDLDRRSKGKTPIMRKISGKELEDIINA